MIHFPASMNFISRMLALLALPGSILAAESPAWEQQDSPVSGVPYHKVEDLRSFYKLTANSKSSRKGATSIGNADISLELGPGVRELSIGGLLVPLARPLQKDAEGRWLISREDWVCCIDPILRPTYITGREAVTTVILDPGHGGHDTGETTPHLRESDLTLKVAKMLKDELEKQGYKVILTRSEDNFVSDQQRVDTINSGGAGAILLSLHVNEGRSDFQGSSIYTLAPGGDTRPGHAKQTAHTALAYALQSALVTQAGAADAGIRHVHYSLLSSVTCPAVWVELGYATHAQEGAALATPAYQESLVHALAKGISTYAHVANPATHIPVQEKPAPVASSANKAAASQTSAAASSTSSSTTTASRKTSGSSSSTSTSSRKTTGSGSDKTRTTTAQPQKQSGKNTGSRRRPQEPAGRTRT